MTLVSMWHGRESLKRLAALPGDYEVYPGHMGPSTLDRERRCNYFMGAALKNGARAVDMEYI